MKHIGIITPGGDAPGMNACIRAIVRTSIFHGCRVTGIKNGYEGLLTEKTDGKNPDMISLTLRSVSGIIYRGGTILKSTRCKAIHTQGGIDRACASLRDAGIDSLLVIGGDGSLRAGLRIARGGIPVIGIPASIDNDIAGTEETIGFDSALDTAVYAVDKIRDTATSFNRIFIVEVMGREHGFLALAIGLASGAEFVMVPEIKYDLKELKHKLNRGKGVHKTSEIIIFAEGAGDVREFARLLEKKVKIEVRVSSLGYIQRGGSPSARSRILGSRFGDYAVSLARKGKKNRLVVLKGSAISDIPLDYPVKHEKKIDAYLSELINRLSI